MAQQDGHRGWVWVDVGITCNMTRGWIVGSLQTGIVRSTGPGTEIMQSADSIVVVNEVPAQKSKKKSGKNEGLSQTLFQPGTCAQ